MVGRLLSSEKKCIHVHVGTFRKGFNMFKKVSKLVRGHNYQCVKALAKVIMITEHKSCSTKALLITSRMFGLLQLVHKEIYTILLLALFDEA